MSIAKRELAEMRAFGGAPGRASWSRKVEIIPITGEWKKSDKEIRRESINGTINFIRPVTCLSDYGKALWVSIYTGDSGEVAVGVCPSCGQTVFDSFSDSWKVEVCEIEYKADGGYTFSNLERLPLLEKLEILQAPCRDCE